MPDSNHLFELGALAAYLLGLFYIGLRSMREVRTSVDYTIAGRQLSWIVVLSTTAATMVGGGASVGMVSQVYKIGIAAAVLTCAWHLQLIITGLWIAPRLRGMNLITIGGFFELKFDDSRICASLPYSSFLLKKAVFLKLHAQNCVKYYF